MANAVYTWKLLTSGTGMAVYRLLCFKSLFKKHLNKKSMATKILVAEWIVTSVAVLLISTL